MTEQKKKKCLPHYGYELFGNGGCGYSGAVFAPLYGPRAAISTAYAEPEDEGPGATAAPEAGEGPEGPEGAGEVGESRQRRKGALVRLNEDLDYLSQVLGGMNAADLPGMFFDQPLVADPKDQTNAPVDAMMANIMADDGDADDDDDDLAIDIALVQASPFCAAITSVIHKNFTRVMDDMVIRGELSQLQRIDLSRCIGCALDAFTAELGECDWADGMQISDETKARFSESKSPRAKKPA